MLTSAWEVLTQVMNEEKEMSVNIKTTSTVGGVLKVKAMNIKLYLNEIDAELCVLAR